MELKSFIVYFLMSANLLGCMKMPEFRESSNALDFDLESPTEDMHVSEADLNALPSDAYISCESTEMTDDGTCLDHSLPPTNC